MNTSSPSRPRLALTAGEPAGIGPELLVKLAQHAWPAELVAITDRDLLLRAARRCDLPLQLHDATVTRPAADHVPGTLAVHHVPLGVDEQPGKPDSRNARHVLATLDHAADGCLDGTYQAVVTAPLQKASINEAGIRFRGHTEYFAARARAEVVMMLASPELRVALVTTHLPLAAVPAAITPSVLEHSVRVVHLELQQKFGIATPRVALLGLNPHAGEGGHMGREEIETIEPVIARLRAEGMQLLGPLPADTAFVPAMRTRYDAVLAMYHDQALPVLKSEAFDRTVNLTLGLPFIRTSVDHGTALDLAGSGRADVASLQAATRLACTLAERARQSSTALPGHTA